MLPLILAVLALLGPSGPYCGTSESDFTAPTPLECDEGYHHDTNCVRACAALYRAEVQIAYEAACAHWNTAYNAWDAAQDIVDADLNACLALAQGFPAMVDACNQQWGASSQALQQWLDAELAKIQSDIDGAIVNAEASFQECAAQCCVPDEFAQRRYE